MYSRSLLRALSLLAGQKLLPAAAVEELDAAYRYLRRVENRLQEWNDEQTHELPADEAGRMRLAATMGAADWAAFAKAIRGAPVGDNVKWQRPPGPSDVEIVAIDYSSAAAPTRT